MILRQAISNLVRAHRNGATAPLTQEELAYRSGISYEHLNHIENYRTTPSIQVLDRIARSLGFRRVSELLARDESRQL